MSRKKTAVRAENMSEMMIELKQRSVGVAHIVSAQSVLSWDQEVYMPKRGAASRAKTIAYLAGLAHTAFIGINADKLLSRLKRGVDGGLVKGDDAVIVLETWRAYERQQKLPVDFVRESAETYSNAQQIWAKARAASDFMQFLPWLRKIISLKRKEAEYVGYKESAYDALLDAYEPGMTAASVAAALEELKGFLIPFIQRIKESKEYGSTLRLAKRISGEFGQQDQHAFNMFVAKTIGYDLEAGRVDVSTHPFTTTFSPTDVRITTRYNPSNVLDALTSTVHEVGHALYEQGLREEHFGLPLGESVSLGIHESQSRLWENMIGRSYEFWAYFYPHMQKAFPKPFKNVPLDEFYRIVNMVNPSYIRVEADEVTYNLHIILRFEIEKMLIEGTLKPEDVPAAWNAKMKEYFGIDVSNDRQGCLQDVHWSCGLIGYFPTYSLGNIYGAQFYAALRKDMPRMDAQILHGEFGDIREWLRKKIHQHGKRYGARQLARRISKEDLSSRHFIRYIEQKYSKLYNI